MAVNYDDAFRTLLNDCPQLILPVLNETFGTSYDGTEKIEFEPNINAVQDLIAEYEEIRKHLEILSLEGSLSLAEKYIIMDMINHVAQLRCARLERIKEGVEQIMAGKMLYSEAAELRNQGREEGREEEHEKEMVSGIRRAMDKQHLSFDDALEYMDIPKPEWHKYALHFCEPEVAVKYQYE